MKKLLHLLALIPFFNLLGQNSAYDFINPNLLRAGVSSDGTLFNNETTTNTNFYAPASDSTVSVFSGGLWIGGASSTKLHTASTTSHNSSREFWPGPIRNSIHYSQDANYKWNRVWKVSKNQVLYHNNYYTADNYNMPDGILNWPGNGDVSKGEAAQLAPFTDLNNNGIYEPNLGDHPKIKGDEAVYFIYNDDMDVHATGGEKLKVEIHGMMYGFACSQSEALKNSLFIDYKIINRSDSTYTNTWIGAFSDIDLGNSEDDRIISDVTRNLFYVYNGDTNDETIGSTYGYGTNIPVQSLMLLKGAKMDSDLLDNQFGTQDSEFVNAFGINDNIVDNERFGMSRFMSYSHVNSTCCNKPTTHTQYYNYMRGIWKDGSRLYYGGNGHVSYIPPSEYAKFLFSHTSDPYFYGTDGIDPTFFYNYGDWREESESLQMGDRHGLLSMGPFTFKPGDIQEISLVYIFARDESTANDSQLLLNYADEIKSMYDSDETPCDNGVFSGIARENESHHQLSIYPNPTSDKLYIATSVEIKNYQLCDAFGRVVSEGLITESRNINVSTISTGVYFLKLETNSEVQVLKFIKQ